MHADKICFIVFARILIKYNNCPNCISKATYVTVPQTIPVVIKYKIMLLLKTNKIWVCLFSLLVAYS